MEFSPKHAFKLFLLGLITLCAHAADLRQAITSKLV